MLQYAELVADLPRIKKLGWVRTHRAGDTGVGKTLEDLLGIQENNIAGPNGHQTELKAARRGTSSMLTLFTLAPLPPKINIQLWRKFGKDNSTSHRKKLHTTVNALDYNKLYGEPAFKIEVMQSRIELRHVDYGDLPTPYWNRVDLEQAFTRKYRKNLLYVKADKRGSGSGEEFHYAEAWLMSGFSFKNFVELLNAGSIVVDIRIGRYPDGRPHDHGTGFRVDPDHLDSCFEKREPALER